MKVTFRTDPELSLYHALRVTAAGQVSIDNKLESLLTPSVVAMNERLELVELDVAKFWEALFLSSCGDEPQRCEQSLLQAGCSELGIDSLMPALLGRLADARQAMRERFPKLKEQLPLRAGPLRELWESCGRGLLKSIGRQTLDKLIPPRTTLHLLQPIRGGDGGLLEEADSCWMEAVLTHPDPAIPETLRLAWLITCRGWAKEENQEARALGHATALALIPYVLRSGEELGLCSSSERTIAAAAQLWRLETDADVLVRWWEEMQQNQLPLPVAIRALDKMLN